MLQEHIIAFIIEDLTNKDNLVTEIWINVKIFRYPHRKAERVQTLRQEIKQKYEVISFALLTLSTMETTFAEENQ